MKTDRERRLMIALGAAAAAIGCAIWLAVTANAIGVGLVVSDLGFAPLPGLLIGKLVAIGLLAMFIPLAVRGRRVLATRTRSALFSSSVLFVLLATGVLTVWLWNLQAHRIGSHPVEVVGEAGLMLAAVSVVAAVSTLGVVRLHATAR
jgi:hypothetical protein